MNCYDCHPQVEAAVAVCQLCGKGLCHDHVMRFDRRVQQVDPAALGRRTLPTGKTIPRLLCTECGEAVGVKDEQETIKIVPE
jgi:hypothetical protein